MTSWFTCICTTQNNGWTAGCAKALDLGTNVLRMSGGQRNRTARRYERLPGIVRNPFHAISGSLPRTKERPRQDLNLEPPACEAGTLSIELRGQSTKICGNSARSAPTGRAVVYLEASSGRAR